MFQPTMTPGLFPPAYAILEHLLRYRLSVLPAIVRLTEHKLIEGSGPSLAIADLVQAGLVGASALYDRQQYFFLTDPGLAACGGTADADAAHWSGPLPERAKILNYAILAFCCLSNTPRQRLTRDDFKQHFATLLRPGLPMNYYVDRSGERPRLGFVRVDMGGHGRWDRVVAKCCDDWRAHEAQSGFRRFIERDQFEITVVTALPQKADRLRDSLAAQRQEMTVRTCAVPRLLNLIAPPPK